MDNYKYSYHVGLTTIRKDIQFNFTEDMLEDNLMISEFIKTKIQEFSSMSMNSVRNRKYVDIDSIQISKDTISFVLYSENELPVVGKCIRLLSQLLLSEQYFVDLLLNKKLFKTYIPTQVVDEETGTVQVVDVSDSISDAEFVKALIDYLLMSKYPYSQEKNDMNNGIKEMKSIAVKAGIIKI